MGEESKKIKIYFRWYYRVLSAPRYRSDDLGVLTAGTKCIVCVNSRTKDAGSKYEYIKLYDRDGWIVTSAVPI